MHGGGCGRRGRKQNVGGGGVEEDGSVSGRVGEDGIMRRRGEM
jgi:hypothetical protein